MRRVAMRCIALREELGRRSEAGKEGKKKRGWEGERERERDAKGVEQSRA